MLLLPKAVPNTPQSTVPLDFPSPKPKSHLNRNFAGSYQDVVPAVLPFYHIFGLTLVLVGSLFNGCKIVTLPKLDTKSFFKLLDQHQVLSVPSNISTERFGQQCKKALNLH